MELPLPLHPGTASAPFVANSWWPFVSLSKQPADKSSLFWVWSCSALIITSTELMDFWKDVCVVVWKSAILTASAVFCKSCNCVVLPCGQVRGLGYSFPLLSASQDIHSPTTPCRDCPTPALLAQTWPPEMDVASPALFGGKDSPLQDSQTSTFALSQAPVRWVTAQNINRGLRRRQQNFQKMGK